MGYEVSTELLDMWVKKRLILIFPIDSQALIVHLLPKK